MPRLKPIQTMPDEPLELPIMTADGTFHIYRVQPVSAEMWFRFAALGQALEDRWAGRDSAEDDDAALKEFSDMGVRDIHKASLGADVIAAMMNDGVSAADIRRAHTTALVWHTSGGNLERAEAAWETPGETEPEPESISTITVPASGTKRRRPSNSTTSLPKSSTNSEARSA